MNYSTTYEDKEEFEQEFLDDKTSQSIAKSNQNNSITVNQEKNYLKETGPKIIPNLLICVGVFFSLISSSTLSNFLMNKDNFSPLFQWWSQVIYLIGGLIVLFLSLGRRKEKSNWLLYAFTPLIGILFSISFNLLPKEWLFLNAWAYSIFF
jgi:cell division protein FtsW (lipid II flippase)